MNELTSLGLILLLALLAGHLVKVVRIPEVTGYILAGIALGPSVLGWVTAENLTALEVLSEVALGLILFSIGSVFQFSRFRRLGRQFLYLTLAESVLASVIVTVSVLALGQPWQVALLLGAIAIATAPASTLMVIRECDSSGPLTDNLLGIIAVNTFSASPHMHWWLRRSISRPDSVADRSSLWCFAPCSRSCGSLADRLPSGFWSGSFWRAGRTRLPRPEKC